MMETIIHHVYSCDEDGCSGKQGVTDMLIPAGWTEVAFSKKGRKDRNEVKRTYCPDHSRKP